MIYILGIVVILFLLLNHTIVFHRKLRLNVFTEKYSHTKDLWFKKDGNTKLIIFLHGMFSTPSTFEDLAEILLLKGWDVYIPTLPASAISREDLQSIGSWAWKESLIIIREKINSLPNNYQKVVLGGHSQGGSLAMNIATERSFDGLIVVSSPVNLYGNHLKLWQNIAIYLSGLLSFVFPNGVLESIPYQQERAEVEKLCDAEGIQYPYTIHTFKKGLKILRQNLYKIKMPLFLAYCKGDILVNFKNLELIKNSVSSKKIIEKTYDISFEEEPYGFRHQLLNYSKTKNDLNVSIVSFLENL
ncbi:MAG: alpha/beta fold hydrolase [Spirochaetota bacterium]|nr:alpha/beta fold hydrolase [Spirochaetota bacterium]